MEIILKKILLFYLGINVLFIISSATITTTKPTTTIVHRVSIICVKDTKKYCLNKPNGFKFNNGCKYCYCVKNQLAHCPAKRCKFFTTNKRTMYQYCKRIERRNEVSFNVFRLLSDITPEHLKLYTKHNEYKKLTTKQSKNTNKKVLIKKKNKKEIVDNKQDPDIKHLGIEDNNGDRGRNRNNDRSSDNEHPSQPNYSQIQFQIEEIERRISIDQRLYNDYSKQLKFLNYEVRNMTHRLEQSHINKLSRNHQSILQNTILQTKNEIQELETKMTKLEEQIKELQDEKNNLEKILNNSSNRTQKTNSWDYETTRMPFHKKNDDDIYSPSNRERDDDYNDDRYRRYRYYRYPPHQRKAFTKLLRKVINKLRRIMEYNLMRDNQYHNNYYNQPLRYKKRNKYIRDEYKFLDHINYVLQLLDPKSEVNVKKMSILLSQANNTKNSNNISSKKLFKKQTLIIKNLNDMENKIKNQLQNETLNEKLSVFMPILNSNKTITKEHVKRIFKINYKYLLSKKELKYLKRINGLLYRKYRNYFDLSDIKRQLMYDINRRNNYLLHRKKYRRWYHNGVYKFGICKILILLYGAMVLFLIT